MAVESHHEILGQIADSAELKSRLGLPVLTSEVIDFTLKTSSELKRRGQEVEVLKRINMEFSEEHRAMSGQVFRLKNDLAASRAEAAELTDVCQRLYAALDELRSENSRLRQALRMPPNTAALPVLRERRATVPTQAELHGLYSSVPASFSSVQWELSPAKPAEDGRREAPSRARPLLGEEEDREWAARAAPPRERAGPASGASDAASHSGAETDSDGEGAPPPPAAGWSPAGPGTPPRPRPGPPSGYTPPSGFTPHSLARPLSPPEPLRVSQRLGESSLSVFSTRHSSPFLVALRTHQSRLEALEREHAERAAHGSPAQRSAPGGGLLDWGFASAAAAAGGWDHRLTDRLRQMRRTVQELAACKIQAFARGWRARRALGGTSAPARRGGRARGDGAAVRRVMSRFRTKRELLTTERGYLAGLRALLQAFARPMREAARGPSAAVPARLVEELFAGVDALWGASRVLLADLEAAAAQPPRFQALGSVFLRHAPVLRAHYADFIRNWSAATTALARLRSAGAGGALAGAGEFVRRLEREAGVELDSLLITPVQRVPRYILLLESLLGHTEPSHPEFRDLHHALLVCRQLAATVSEARAQAENASRVLRIEAAVQRGPPPGRRLRLLAPHRRLVRDGEVRLVRAGPRPSGAAALLSSLVGLEREAEPAARVLYLFSDVVVCAENLPPAGPDARPALAVQFHLPLERALVEELPDADDPHLPKNRFVLRAAPADPLGLAASPAGGEGGGGGARPAGEGEVHVLAAASGEERAAWCRAIRGCIAELQRAIAGCERLLAVPAELRATRRAIAADLDARRLVDGELRAATARLLAADAALPALAAAAARAPPPEQPEATRRLREAQAERGTELGALGRLLAASCGVCERLEAARDQVQRQALIAAVLPQLAHLFGAQPAPAAPDEGNDPQAAPQATLRRSFTAPSVPLRSPLNLAHFDI